MSRHLWTLGSLLALTGIALVGASAGAAAPTGTNASPPTNINPPDGGGGGGGANFLFPGVIPTYVWRFNGNMEDSGPTHPRGNLERYDSSTPLAAFKPGRDGSPNGSSTEVGRFHDPRNAFREEAFTWVFDIFPEGQNGCINGELFADGRALPGLPGVTHPYHQGENFIGVHGCPGTTMPSSVTVSFKNKKPDNTFVDVKLTASMSSGAWHDVIVVYDGAKQLLSMFVDGVKTTAPLVGAITLTGDSLIQDGKTAFVNDVLIGGPMMINTNFWSAGRVNELKYFGGRALYPVPALNANAAANHGAMH